MPFHLLAKPTQAACNLDCKFCFYLSKNNYYPNERTRLSSLQEELEIYP